MAKIAMVIAHNEAKTISNVVTGLLEAKKQGVIDSVIVVNDGSTDKTSKLAKSLGVKVIDLPLNVGKGQAFIEGVKYCAKQNAEFVLTFDGDLLSVSPRQVKQLLKPLKNPKTKMVVGTVRGDGTALSGERAIRMSALKPLYQAGNKNWIRHMQGFGLEATLNHYLGLKSVFLPKIMDLFGGRIYNGFHPFNKEVVLARTRFKALPFNRRGNHVTEEAVRKRLELIRREDTARIYKQARKLRDKGKTREQIIKKLRRL
jgi:polyisoprenyl-phosphate glycosyltransferase